MAGRIRKAATIAVGAGFILFGTLGSIVAKDRDISETERRNLAQLPKLSAVGIADGTYMDAFTKYTQDQFVYRDAFRTIKAYVSLYGLNQKDNNGYFIADGHISKTEYPLNENSVENVVKHITNIYDKYLKDKDIDVYMCVVPDKNRYIANKNGYLSIEYDIMTKTIKEELEFAHYIEIADTLDEDSYYRTDIHWRQDKITGTARRIADECGVSLGNVYTDKQIYPFYGVYYGQMGIQAEPDVISCLTWQGLEDCTVYDYETGMYIPVYEYGLADGNDAYRVYLSGSKSLLEIANPNITDGRELIMFRDSFGSSIAPLLLEGYSRITLVDTRYISSQILDRFIEFDDQDVMFMYSAPVINNSSTFR